LGRAPRLALNGESRAAGQFAFGFRAKGANWFAAVYCSDFLPAIGMVAMR
jgi:hypothetical protein